MDVIDQIPPATTEELASQTVRRFVAWSAGAGILPVPGVNLAAVAGVQLKMLHDLSKLYGFPFSSSLGKSLIGALVGTGSAATLTGTAAFFFNMIPVVGHISTLLVQPALAAASTYAVGKVFIQHFESGGTLLDFDPEKMREYYRTYFEAAKQQPSKTAKASA